MVNNRTYLTTELLLLFFILPSSLYLEINPIFKISSLLIAIIYCIYISRKQQLLPIKSLVHIEFKKHLKTLGFTALIVGLSSFVFMYILHPNDLFIVVKKKPLMWVAILFFYAIFSVLPQEILYRSFFFSRYNNLFKNRNYLLLLNILAFPIAHLMFDNVLVLFVTFIGGIFFTLTYNRTKSVLFTSIEHAIYGNWLFTIGMGEMLAFPMPN